MDALILAGSALLTVLAVCAIAIVVTGARADRTESGRSGRRVAPARGAWVPARRFRRQARPRSSARR
jgi:hypothetical protein